MDNQTRMQIEEMFSHREALIDVDDVESDLGLGHGTIRTWISRQTCPIPFLRIRSRVKIRKTALIDWLVTQEVTQEPVYTKRTPVGAASPGNGIKRKGRPPRVPDLAREAARHER